MAAPGITAPGTAALADGDVAAERPAARVSVATGHSIVTGWLCRGNGSPLELITTAGPADSAGRPDPVAAAGRGKHAAFQPGRSHPAGLGAEGGTLSAGGEAPAPEPLLFPPGALGLPAAGCVDDLDQLVWVPCPAVRDLPSQRADPAGGPSLFETALIALMPRPFGWLVVAKPTDLPAAETAGLRTELDGLRQHQERRASLAAEQAKSQPAGRVNAGDVGVWSVRVLVGASSAGELDVLAPLLAGSVELGPSPYRLRHISGAYSLTDALSARWHDPADGAQSPFFTTAGTLAALAGLPRLGVPGLNLTRKAGGVPHASPVALPGGDAPGASHVPGASSTPHGSEAPNAPEVSVGADGRSGADGSSSAESPDGSVAPDPVPPDPVAPDRSGRARNPLRIPVPDLSRGVLVAGRAGAGKSQTVRNLLAQLSPTGLPWLVIDPADSGYDVMAAGADGAQVIVVNPGDPDAAPLTVSPLAPEPGYPLQAHIAMLGWLLDVSFDADEPLSLAISLALQRVYQAAGWDLVTGRGAGPALAAPAVPELRQVHAALVDVIARSGYDRKTRARLRGLADVRFGSLLAGSAGRFLEGGHPADVGTLLRRNVVLAIHDIAAGPDRALVTGALIIRVAEHLRLGARAQPARAVPATAPPAGLGQPDWPEPPGPGLRHLLVIEEARGILRDRGARRPATRAAERFAALLAELGSYGAGTILTEQSPGLLVTDVTRNAAVRTVRRPPAAPGHDAAGRPPTGDGAAPGAPAALSGSLSQPCPVPAAVGQAPGAPAAGASAAVMSVLDGRRSPACGRQCRDVRACRLAEIRGAELLAGSAEHAWLRVWMEIFVLAFLTDNPLPAVPAPLRRRWRSLAARPRECLLAHVAGRCISSRSAALRASYDPERLLQVVAAAATTRLNGPSPGPAAWAPGGVPAVTRPGPAWVVPQLRWLHEAERLCPLGGARLTPADHAPPLDFDLAGLPDWPGIRVGQRIRALRRHPLSIELAANRRLAWTALVGDQGPGPFADDLSQVTPGVDHAQALRHTAGLMEVSGGVSSGPGWLEIVLSWPRRFVALRGREPRPGDAADCLPA